MFAIAKLAILALVAVVLLALNADCRELLDYDGDRYNECYRGYNNWDWGRGDYYCQGRRWRHDGGWYDGGGWRYGGGGFCLGVCGK